MIFDLEYNTPNVTPTTAALHKSNSTCKDRIDDTEKCKAYRIPQGFQLPDILLCVERNRNGLLSTGRYNDFISVSIMTSWRDKILNIKWYFK